MKQIAKLPDFKNVAFSNFKYIINDGAREISFFEQGIVSQGFFLLIATVIFSLLLFIKNIPSLKEVYNYHIPNKFLLYIFIGIIIILMLGMSDVVFKIEAPKIILFDNKNISTLFLAICGIGIATPIAEEMLFRGFLLKGALKLCNFIKINEYIAVAWVSIVFTIAHMQYNLVILLILSVLSIYLTYITYKTKSLLPSTLLHIINNTITTIYSYINT